MRVISNKALVDFAKPHPEAAQALQVWRRLLEVRSFASFAEIKSVFNAVDKVGEFHVFDIGGNKFRIIAFIDFHGQKAYIKHVFTHKGYDKWKP